MTWLSVVSGHPRYAQLQRLLQTKYKIHSCRLVRSPPSTLKYNLFCNTDMACVSSQYKTWCSYTSGVEYSGDLIRVPSLSRRQKSSSICTPGYGEAPDGRNKEEAAEWHNPYFPAQWIKHVLVISAEQLRLPTVWQKKKLEQRRGCNHFLSTCFIWKPVTDSLCLVRDFNHAVSSAFVIWPGPLQGKILQKRSKFH